MKKIYFILISIVLINSCSKEQKQILEGTVTPSAGLIMRSEPSASGAKIDFLPQGTLIAILYKDGPIVEVNEKEGRWYQIKYNDKTGWAFGYFISIGNHQKDIVKQNQIIKDLSNKGFIFTKSDLSGIDINLDNIKLISNNLDADCNSESWNIKETIIIKDGKVKYKYEENFNDEFIMEYEGICHIEGNKLIITFNESTRKTIIHATGVNHDLLSKRKMPKIYILHYYKRPNGFFTENQLNTFLNKKIYHNEEKHYICLLEVEIANRICASVSPEFRSEFEKHINLSGYFYPK